MAAEAPLLRAGLVRAAHAAGFESVADPGVAVDVTLRTAKAAAPSSPIQITADDRDIVLVVTAPPDPAVWSQVRGVIEQLLG